MNRFINAAFRSVAPVLATIVVVVFASGCAFFGRPKPVDTGYVIHDYESQIFERTRQFAMYVPDKYNESRREWPLILFLHGYGECGDQIDLTLVHGPLKEAIGRENLDFLMIAPQIPKPELNRIASGWRDFEPDLLHILERVQNEYRVDSTRIYLTGISMGGFGTFAVAADYPELFAAAVPICGGGSATDALKYGSLPFWIFHGEKDRTVPVNRSVEMKEAMEALGCNVKLTTYPEAGHDSWTETYQNDELYAWFLSHRNLPDN